MTSNESAGLPTARTNALAGTILIAIAGLHIAFVLALGSGLLQDAQMRELVDDRAPLLMMKPGFGSAQPPNLLLLTLFWSLFFGVALATLGVLIRAVEQRRSTVPRSVGGLLLGMCLLGAILVPVSGFWFGLVPAFMILRQRTRVDWVR